jgi:serine/threonine protein kinase/tetratricopeptide (TPR) repeat protein
MPADAQRLKDLFLAAIERTDPAERQAFVERECADDAELRQQLQVLLDAHDRPNPILEQPLAGRASPENGRTGPHIPAMRELAMGSIFAGRYKVREKLGEGGMGAVYVADQTEPVSRRVALKVVKADVSSARLLARFEQERQALALMDHPHIAKVLDAGIADGVPYFVMELIKGVPITKYCDEAKLTPRQRLELFVPVCQAVQHAHQKGIIHRDLKPSNILVGLYDGKAVPKVIDFGVAKATGSKLSEHSIYTEVGQIVGTLEYMSPEQAELNNLDIDTRTDVYALGVVLYELLTGTVPFSRKELQCAALVEMLRIIKEVEPPRPSTRLSSSGSLPSIAATRQMEPQKLTRLVRGELDWMVMKALEKDRSRRYETANAFALDIQRYLTDEPVVAGPPSAGYRLRKFVKRNRPQVIASFLVLIALLCGVVGTTWGLLRAEQSRREAESARKAEAEQRAEAETQRDNAVAAERLAADRLREVQAEQKRALKQTKRAEANEKKAEHEKRIAQAVRDFLQTNLLGQADATAQADALLRQGGFAAEANRNLTIRELLDRAAAELSPEKIEANFPKQPLLQAEILQTMGTTYRGVGEPGLSVAFLQRSAALSRQHLGPDDPTTLTTLSNLARAYLAAGKPADAIRLLEQLGVVDEKRLGLHHPDTLNTLHNLAIAYGDAGKLAEATHLLEQIKEPCVKRLGLEHTETLAVLHNLAVTYHEAGRLADAIGLLERLRIALEKKNGPGHPRTRSTVNALALAYKDSGKPTEAIRLFEQLRAGDEKLHGPNHPNTLITLNNLGLAYKASGQTAKAIQVFEQVRVGFETQLGPNHPSTLIALDNLAGAYLVAMRFAKAIQLLEQVSGASEKSRGPDHPSTLTALNNLAVAYSSARLLDKAIPLYQTVLPRMEAKLGRDHPTTLSTLANLGVSYRDAGRLDEAIELLEEVHRKSKSYPSLAWVERELQLAYASAGKTAMAVRMLHESLERARKRVPPGSHQLAVLLSNAGGQLLNLKQYDDAERILRESLAICVKLSSQDTPAIAPWRVPAVQRRLGAALLGQKKYTAAEPLLLTGYRGLKKHEKLIEPGTTHIGAALQELVKLYDATGKKEDAARWRKELDALNNGKKP